LDQLVFESKVASLAGVPEHDENDNHEEGNKGPYDIGIEHKPYRSAKMQSRISRAFTRHLSGTSRMSGNFHSALVWFRVGMAGQTVSQERGRPGSNAPLWRFRFATTRRTFIQVLANKDRPVRRDVRKRSWIGPWKNHRRFQRTLAGKRTEVSSRIGQAPRVCRLATVDGK